MSRVLIPVGVLLMIASFAGAVAIALFPLSPLKEFGTPTGWCGPGYASYNALQVRVHPDDVNVGSGGSTDGQEAFKQFCLGQANSRLWESAVTLLVGFLLASGCGFVAAVDQRRTT